MYISIGTTQLMNTCTPCFVLFYFNCTTVCYFLPYYVTPNSMTSSKNCITPRQILTENEPLLPCQTYPEPKKIRILILFILNNGVVS